MPQLHAGIVFLNVVAARNTEITTPALRDSPQWIDNGCIKFNARNTKIMIFAHSVRQVRRASLRFPGSPTKFNTTGMFFGLIAAKTLKNHDCRVLVTVMHKAEWLHKLPATLKHNSCPLQQGMTIPPATLQLQRPHPPLPDALRCNTMLWFGRDTHDVCMLEVYLNIHVEHRLLLLCQSMSRDVEHGKLQPSVFVVTCRQASIVRSHTAQARFGGPKLIRRGIWQDPC